MDAGSDMFLINNKGMAEFLVVGPSGTRKEELMDGDLFIRRSTSVYSK